jgi:hypothetical protein
MGLPYGQNLARQWGQLAWHVEEFENFCAGIGSPGYPNSMTCSKMETAVNAMLIMTHRDREVNARHRAQNRLLTLCRAISECPPDCPSLRFVEAV